MALSARYSPQLGQTLNMILYMTRGPFNIKDGASAAMSHAKRSLCSSLIGGCRGNNILNTAKTKSEFPGRGFDSKGAGVCQKRKMKIRLY
jgi:hypothetical protein